MLMAKSSLRFLSSTSNRDAEWAVEWPRSPLQIDRPWGRRQGFVMERNRAAHSTEKHKTRKQCEKLIPRFLRAVWELKNVGFTHPHFTVTISTFPERR